MPSKPAERDQVWSRHRTYKATLAAIARFHDGRPMPTDAHEAATEIAGAVYPRVHKGLTGNQRRMFVEGAVWGVFGWGAETAETPTSREPDRKP